MQLEPKNTAPLHESHRQPKILRLVRMEESENTRPTDHFAKCWGYSGKRCLGMRCLSSIAAAQGPGLVMSHVRVLTITVSTRLLSPAASPHLSK